MANTFKKQFDNVIKKIKPAIQKKIDTSLYQDVYPAVAKKESRVIQDEVYEAYTPKEYIRRFDEFGGDDGLASLRNIEIRRGVSKNGILVVVNTTEPNPEGCPKSAVTTDKLLPNLVEYGNRRSAYGKKYDFVKDPKAAYLKPRPFTKKTVEALEEDKDHIKAIKRGLRRQGLKVK